MRATDPQQRTHECSGRAWHMFSSPSAPYSTSIPSAIFTHPSVIGTSSCSRTVPHNNTDTTNQHGSGL